MSADKGARPAAPKHLGYEWACLFGAVCPTRATGAALVLPYANAAMMRLHLAEISKQVASSSHAVVVVDGAGWHQQGRRVTVPDNTTPRASHPIAQS